MPATLEYTPLEDIKKIYDRVSATYKSGVTRDLAYRRKQLLQLARAFQNHAKDIEDAVFEDLGRHRLQTAVGEVSPVILNCLEAAEHLAEWAAPEKPVTEAWRASWDATIYKVPKGVALIISPWNYPFVLTFNPFIGAIAAGCPAVLKPSEASPTCAALLTKLVAEYLDPNAYVVVNGGPAETAELLKYRWDHIFFTGGNKVGEIVATAAAKHVTPLTLELGGKSPVIVDVNADLELAAKRTLIGKAQNSGQICVSPDYVLVPRAIFQQFVEALDKAYKTFWPRDPLDPEFEWGKIINKQHHDRLKGMLARTNGEIILGGQSDEKRIAPTVIARVTKDDALMQEENFGPVLPLVEVEDVDEAIRFVAERPIPLTLYCYTTSEETKEKLLNKTNSGSLVLNDVISQLIVHEMPFGGHGHSGYGRYFGKATFDTFTHFRSFINVPPEFEEFNQKFRYPPFTEETYNILSAAVKTPIPEA
ncbi:aldehyde dehydrogenase [Panus rudis PR-1116 ss-1]|nr:aldehyde dehydrogenase [Panus rudis PR-1116 ss-1]